MENKICPVCGARVDLESKFINRLSDGTAVCERCAAKTRFLYPVKSDTRVDEKKEYHRIGKLSGGSSTQYFEYRILVNPVETMTLEEFRQALDEIDRKRAQEPALYGEAKCVIQVENCWKIIPTYKDLNGEEKYKKEMPYWLSGRILRGELHKGDVLHVRRKEREERITVTQLKNSPANTLTFDADAVYEGSYAHFSVSEEAFFVYPADIIFAE